jgi:mono/diheme cytochrome c family protein
MYLTGRVFLACVAIVAMLIALTYLFAGCDYARMKDQESVRTYEAEMPQAVEGTIPVTGGIEVLKSERLVKIRNPLLSTQETLERGRTAYGYFCIVCHGPNLDGNGTVGQSFAPLPTDLKSTYVREQNDGTLFYKISLGYRRHPPLAHTVFAEDRWSIITYIRSLANESKG